MKKFLIGLLIVALALSVITLYAKVKEPDPTDKDPTVPTVSDDVETEKPDGSGSSGLNNGNVSSDTSDSSSDSESDPVTMITFTVDVTAELTDSGTEERVSFTCPQGMTWSDFAASDYADDLFFVQESDDTVWYQNDKGEAIINSGGAGDNEVPIEGDIFGDQVIMDGYHYGSSY